MNQPLQKVNTLLNAKAPLKIIRLPAVKNLTGYSRSAIYLKMAQGEFPAAISLGSRAVGWIESEIINWIEQRIQISRPIIS